MILPPELLLDSMAGKGLPFSVRALNALPERIVKLDEASATRFGDRIVTSDLSAPRDTGLLILLLRWPDIKLRAGDHTRPVTLFCGMRPFAQTLFVKYDKIDSTWSATAVLLPIPPRQVYSAQLPTDWPLECNTIEFWGGHLPADFWNEQ